MSEVPQMTEKTQISLPLALTLLGIVSAIAGSYAVLSSQVADIRKDADAENVSRRLSRIEYVLCATEDPSRSLACERLGMARQ